MPNLTVARMSVVRHRGMEGPIVPRKWILSVLAAAALVGAACGTTASPSAADSPANNVPERPPNVLYGHITSMVHAGRDFEIRFDPAWWLSGVAAQRAALEDTGSSDVPNDYRVVEEGHRLLTFAVQADAEVSVLTGAAQTTSISAAELAEIVNGENPRHRRLFQPKAGFWIQIGTQYPNPAERLDQQYQP
jgi:hypothetical protein